MSKSSFNKQFKRGAYPVEHWDESTAVNGHEPDSPAKSRKRQSIALGSQTEARPGIVGKQDFKRRR